VWRPSNDEQRWITLHVADHGECPAIAGLQRPVAQFTDGDGGDDVRVRRPRVRSWSTSLTTNSTRPDTISRLFRRASRGTQFGPNVRPYRFPYLVGFPTAVFAVVLYKVVRSPAVSAALSSMVESALHAI